MTWKSALTRAINAEVAAEKAATQAEEVRRQTWWATTWALAAVPRSDWGEAQAEYVKRTNHSASTAKNRRLTGERLPESTLGSTLPMPRFAQAAATWIGKDGDEAKVKEAIKLLAQAEKDDVHLRAFNQLLTGKPWTNSPENLTEADEDAVVEKVARQRPHSVARHTSKPQVAAAIVADPKATQAVIQQQSKRTQRLVKARKEAEVAAGADVKGENAAVADASGVSMDTTPAYTKLVGHQGQMITTWLENSTGRSQVFNRTDIHFMLSDQEALDRHANERRVFVVAAAEGRDPWQALTDHRAMVEAQYQRELDEAEADTDIDAGLDEIERFANEAI